MKRKKLFLALMAVVVVVVAMIAASEATYNPKQIWARFGGPAGEVLLPGQLVMVASSGYIYLADADNSALRPAVGVVGSGGAAAEDSVEIVPFGIFSGWSGLTPGEPAFLSTTPGAVTQTAPTWVQNVGFAVSSTRYLFLIMVTGSSGSSGPP